jgi:hypothetical protein
LSRRRALPAIPGRRCRLVEVAEAVVESQLLLLPKQSLAAEDASQL